MIWVGIYLAIGSANFGVCYFVVEEAPEQWASWDWQTRAEQIAWLVLLWPLALIEGFSE